MVTCDHEPYRLTVLRSGKNRSHRPTPSDSSLKLCRSREKPDTPIVSFRLDGSSAFFFRPRALREAWNFFHSSCRASKLGFTTAG